MAPLHSRHLLVWTTLPIAILLSYLWFKRKRVGVASDPGEINSVANQEPKNEKSLAQELEEAEKVSRENKTIKRSLSGVESSPIDIVFPPELKSSKSCQLIISDEDLDLEIEKIKSMKNTTKSVDRFNKNKQSPKLNSPVQNKEVESAKKEDNLKVAEKPSPKQAVSPVKAKEPEAKKEEQPLQIDPPNKVTPKRKKNKMVEKDIVTGNLEKKMNSLKVESNSNKHNKVNIPTATVTDQELFKQNCERDSANHSPADVMLASPSLSCISDSHSEGSNDSGKGRSEVATPPSRTPAGDGSVSSESTLLPTFYHFEIPQVLVGRLIGRHGSFVTQIKNKTHAHIVIKKHPDDNQLKICTIEGTHGEIDNALEMIRDKFPEKKYPDLTLEQIFFAPPAPTVSLLPEQLCMKLVEGINNDTIVSCMVTPNHLFLQQPTHPSFPNLNMLSDCMNICYADESSPMLPDPLPENPVCAAYNLGAWYRAIVLSTDSDTETSYVKFLDYGGFANIKNSDLRQIRADFLMLPFQAAECFLANIRPTGGDNAEWDNETFNLVADITRGAIMYTQVAEYTDEGIPLVLIYVAVSPQQVVFLNEELVNRGFAEYIPVENYVAEQPASVDT